MTQMHPVAFEIAPFFPLVSVGTQIKPIEHEKTPLPAATEGTIRWTETETPPVKLSSEEPNSRSCKGFARTLQKGSWKKLF